MKKNPLSSSNIFIYFSVIILGLTTILVLGTSHYISQNPITTKNRAAERSNFIQIVDSSASGYGYPFAYSYAPTIVKENGTYHAFFCSTGGSLAGGPAWDYIRYSHSTDGIHWTRPVIKLYATGIDGQDVAACDPSIVYYQGIYYMYYTGGNDQSHGGGGVQVAKSDRIDGDYLTYTQRNTWERTPRDPKILVRAQHPEVGGYGAGQQTVVEYNGRLRMWYTDTSLGGSGGPVLMLDSTDPLQWDISQAREINKRSAHTNDIKYDVANNQFVMVRLAGQGSRYSYVEIGHSSDGLIWNFYTIIPSTEFVDFPGNSGFSGDRQGHVIRGENALFAFGAPYDLRDYDVRGEWDLYGMFVNLDAYLIDLAPIGFEDTTSCTTVTGWVCDPNAYTRPVNVHIYRDGPAGSGIFLGAVTADAQSENAVADACGGKYNHRFSYSLPSSLNDGQQHTIYAYAIGIDRDGNPTGSNPLLGSSPMTVQCPLGTPTPTLVQPTPSPTLTPRPNTPTPTRTPTPTPIHIQAYISCGPWDGATQSYYPHAYWTPVRTAETAQIIDEMGRQWAWDVNVTGPIDGRAMTPPHSIHAHIKIQGVWYDSTVINCVHP